MFPCFFREIFEKNVLDPSHFVEGGRFFFTHKNVCRFNDTMVRRKRADVPVTDFLYVSSDVVLVDHDKLQRTHVKDNLYGVSTNNLSVLTDEQAARNRLCLWKHKLRYLCTWPTYDIFKTWAPPIASLPCRNDDDHDSGDYQEREKMQSLLPTSCPTLKFDDKCDEIIGTKLAHVGEQCFTSRKHKGNNNNDNDDDQDEKEDDGYIVNHENPFDDDDDDDDDDEYADAQQHMAYVQLSAQNGRCKKRLPPPSSTTSKSRRQRTTETHTLKDNDDDEHENDDDKKDVSSSSSSSSARSCKNARHESDKITKLFICAPAHIMLSRDEHTSLRMYAESIKVHFDDDGKKGNGGRVGGFAAAYMRSSKRSDHKAPVYYDTRYDLVTEYANPKWKNGLKEHDGRSRQNNITQEEIANTVNARQMHMVFRRERQYTKGGVVNVESTGVSLRPRGICATLIQILESRIMGHVMVPEFRLLVFSGIMDAFQRWLISTTTSSSRRQKILLDVNNDLSHEEACSVIGAKQNTTSQDDDDGGVVDDSHCTLGHPAESTLLPQHRHHRRPIRRPRLFRRWSH